MLRKIARLAACVAVIALPACTAPGDINAPAPNLGDFALGQTVVVTPTLTKGPFSREVEPDKLSASVKRAVETRLSRHEGTRAYNLGIALEGYVLAKPGIPLVASPKSILLVAVTVWDDAEQEKLNDVPKRFTVVEDVSGDTVVGSGNTQTGDVQMVNLSRNAAKVIEQWLVEQKRSEGWFPAPVTSPTDEEPVPEVAAAEPSPPAVPTTEEPATQPPGEEVDAVAPGHEDAPRKRSIHDDDGMR
jgi:hypothetical protein